MRRSSCFTKKEAHDNRGRTARDPKQHALLKMRCQVWTDPDAFANMICENWPHKRCNSKNEEIYRAGCATFHIVRVDFLDHAVGNHRGARCDTEYEHPDPCWNRDRPERDLSGTQDHDRRAPYDYRFPTSYTIGKPTE